MSNKKPIFAFKAAIRSRLFEVGFVVLAAMGIFVSFALFSYDNKDSAWSQTFSQYEVNNAAGAIGAWIADVGLFYVGFSIILVPVFLLYFAFTFLKLRDESNNDKPKNFIWVKILGLWINIISICGLLDLYVGFVKNLPSTAGGVLGKVVSKSMVNYFNTGGTTLILISLIFAATTMMFGLLWLKQTFNFILFSLKHLFYHLSRVFVLVAKSLWYCLIKFVRYLKTPKVTHTIDSYSQKQQALEKLPLERPKIKKASSSLNKVKARKLAKIERSKKANLQKRPTTVVNNADLPDVNLLQEVVEGDRPVQFSDEFLSHLSKEVETKLLDFGVKAEVSAVYPGPIITRFEMKLAAGVKVSKVSGLSKDLARALSVTRVRVVEVIPGKPVVGLEIPNANRETVRFKELMESQAYIESKSHVTLALGKDISGAPVVANLARMPHLLVAGTTGSGKSVGVNAMLLSMLYKATPDDLKLILIDPKMLELSVYDGIPHLLTPVVTDMKDAAQALRWCVAEMERRYQLMAAIGVRNITGYNNKVAKSENPIPDPLWQPVDGEEPPTLEKLPYIVVTVDEFADMIMVVGKKVEELIARIAQKARAAGIHLILATQRPSVDVITGLIKANVPTRIAFQVSSKIDSRTILDQPGAEQLLGHGDMLYLAPGTGIPIRVHGAFVSDEEVHRVVEDLKNKYNSEVEDVVFGETNFIANYNNDEQQEEVDSLYDQAVFIVTESRKASISYLQRKLKIGYNRSARLIETMEQQGVVSATLQNGGREVLAPPPVGSEK